MDQMRPVSHVNFNFQSCFPSAGARYAKPDTSSTLNTDSEPLGLSTIPSESQSQSLRGKGQNVR